MSVGRFSSIAIAVAGAMVALSIGSAGASERAAWDPYSPPPDLGALTQRIGQSTVTLYCGKTPVSAWSADVRINSEAAKLGYKSFLLTTYSALRPCMYENTRLVEMRYLGVEALAYVWAWDGSSDLVSVYTNLTIPRLTWFGNQRPVSGAWVAAVGSSNGSGVSLSTGSVTAVALRSFTSSFVIAQASAGGPVVNNRGQVIGISSTETSGRDSLVAGTPLLCVDLVDCSRPLDVWVTLTPPSAPIGVVASAGMNSATVSWRPPVSNGGSAILSYTAVANPGGGRCVTRSMQCVVSGLTPGTAYSFTVFASNDMGDGPISMPSQSIMPKAAVPGAVVGLKATAGPGSAFLTWFPPTNASAAVITRYEYRVGTGLWKAVTSTQVSVSGLAKGRATTIQVRAVGVSSVGAIKSVRVTPK